MQQNRPSKSEIIGKVDQAIKAIKNGERTIPFSKHFASDQDDLGISDTKDLWPLLLILLAEVKDIGPYNCYDGARPPEKTYEGPLKGKELWPYCWESSALRKKMYLKFCLVKGHYFYMGCHESKFK